MPTVALYAHTFGQPAPTGVGRYTEQLTRSILAADGARHELRYVVGSSPYPAGGSAPDGLEVVRSRLSRKALHFLWSGSGLPAADPLLGRPDLVHVLAPYTVVPTRAPVVYTIHDLWPLTSPSWYSAKERWMFRRAVADATRRAAAVVVDSEVSADQVADVLGIDRARIRVVHIGVADRFFGRPADDEIARACRAHEVEPGRYLIAVGAVSSRKNLRPLIEALGQVAAGPSPVDLVAAGPRGLGAEETEALVRRRGLSDRVRFTGWLPDPDLRCLVAGAAGLVHPSFDEGFGLTPLEAMASGIPTAVSGAGALPEVVGDASLLVDPADVDGWAVAMRRLVADDDLRADLAARGRARAAGFRWSRVADETIAVHRSVLGS